MNLKETIARTEGRRLEFKEALPAHADLAKTIVAFANDAGGELYVGIKDSPREIVGLPEDDLMSIEEQIGNIIFDRCYSAMNSRQSDARNKVIAPVFKRLGVIDQWGNELMLIAEELQDYPHIDLRWREVGMSFQVQFARLNFEQGQESGQELGHELQQSQELGKEDNNNSKSGSGHELGHELENRTLYGSVLEKLAIEPMSKQELAATFELKKVSGYLNRTIKKLLSQSLIELTLPDTPNHPAQKFRLTERGKTFLNLIHQ
jgi:predicted HTH transcriptional regulator